MKKRLKRLREPCHALVGSALIFLLGTGCAAEASEPAAMTPSDTDEGPGVGDEGRFSVAAPVCSGSLSEVTRLDVCLHFEDETPKDLIAAPRRHAHYMTAGSGAERAELRRFDAGVLGVFSDVPLQVSIEAGSGTARQAEQKAFQETVFLDTVCGVRYSYFVRVEDEDRDTLLVASASGNPVSVIFEDVSKDCARQP